MKLFAFILICTWAASVLVNLGLMAFSEKEHKWAQVWMFITSTVLSGFLLFGVAEAIFK